VAFLPGCGVFTIRMANVLWAMWGASKERFMGEFLKGVVPPPLVKPRLPPENSPIRNEDYEGTMMGFMTPKQ